MCVRVCRWPLIRDKRVRTWRKRRRGEGNRRRGGGCGEGGNAIKFKFKEVGVQNKKVQWRGIISQAVFIRRFRRYLSLLLLNYLISFFSQE